MVIAGKKCLFWVILILLSSALGEAGRAQDRDPCRIELERSQEEITSLRSEIARLEAALNQSTARVTELESSVRETTEHVNRGNGFLSGILRLLLDRVVPDLNRLKDLAKEWKKLVDVRVWPESFIQSALNRVRALAARFRDQVRAVMDSAVRMATLPGVRDLENIIRSRDMARIPRVRGELERIFLPLPSDREASPDLRKLVDAYDSMAAAAWSEAIKFDAAAQREMNVAEGFERSIARERADPQNDTAPGAAPLLKAAGITSAVRQQAHMQMMIAQLMQIKAMEIASENVRNKRLAKNKNDALQILQGLVERAATQTGGRR